MQTTGHSGNPMPQPMQRPGGSGFNSQSAPTPLSIDSGTERGRLPTGPMPTGGVRTGRSGQPSHQPQPNRVGGPLGGPLGGPAGGPSIAVNPITGPSGPPGFRGGNPTIGESGLPNSEANNLPKLPPSLASRPIDFGPYMADLQRRIRRAWIPARQPDSRQVVVVFKIHPNGEMSNLRLTQTSGSAEADQRAMQAVERAAPFRPLPDGQKDEVDIQFTFDYKVFSGSGVFRRF